MTTVATCAAGTPSGSTVGLVFTLAWTLAPPPRGLAAGTHAVTLRWRVRSVNP